MICGEMVNSRPVTPMAVTMQAKIPMADRGFILRIPFYPRTISVTELGRRAGLPYCKLQAKLQTLQDVALIIEDDKQVSRLRRDLSNCI